MNLTESTKAFTQPENVDCLNFQISYVVYLLRFLIKPKFFRNIHHLVDLWDLRANDVSP